MNKPKRTSINQIVLELIYQEDFYQSASFFIPSDTDSELLAIFNDYLTYKTQVDGVITDNLKDYQLSALNSTDRAIIRYSVYQLLKGELPFELVINEALRITKEYDDSSDQKQTKFTNRLLDNIYQAIKK